MPSAFISATASPRALNSCAASTWRGSSRVASITDSTSSGYVGRLPVQQLDGGQRERRQRLVEREVVLQVDGQPHRAALRRPARRAARPRRRPAARGRSRCARRMWRRCAAGSSWLSVSRCRIAANASPGRLDHVQQHRVADREAGLSAARARRPTSRSKVGLPQETKPGGGFLRTTLRRFFGSSPALASAFSFSTTCSGACTTTVPERVEPGPAGPAGDLVELAGLQQPGLGPVVLGQRGEQHGADRHVDADARGCRCRR